MTIKSWLLALLLTSLASIALWKNTRLLSVSAYFLVFLVVLVGAVQATPSSDPATPASLVAGYGQISLYFEANQGQTDSAVQFLTRGHGYSLFITPGEVVLTLRQPDPSAKPFDLTAPETAFGMPPHDRRHRQQDTAAITSVIRTAFPGAAPAADLTVEGLDLLPGYSNYFIGNDPSKWRTNVPHYGRVRYRNLYPGIDLVLYGNPQQLEYDFVVAPGADPNAVRLAFTGTGGVAVDAEGNLVLQVAGGQIIQKAPKVYQVIDGVQRAVAGRYVLHADEAHAQADFEVASPSVVGFQVAAYDRTHPLVIDPVLVYSTYLGGNGDDAGTSIAVDSAGQAYVTGLTSSGDFPTANLLDASRGGYYDAFVTKLDASGRTLIYSTYLGGNGDDQGRGIAVDSAGQAYVTGYTSSMNFPIANARYARLYGAKDAFVTKLDASGRTLVYSTYLGGSSDEYGNSIAVDSAGQAYVTGTTFSTDFPTANPLDAHLGGSSDAFVTKLDASGQTLIYSTYLGGSSQLNIYGDYGNSIAVDSAGSAYVTGETASTDFPTANALDTSLDTSSVESFVTKLDASGRTLVYSTYLGGNHIDRGHGIAVDSAG